MDTKQPDSLATVTVKEYPDNVSYTSDPPPAYRHPRSNSVQVARIVALTVVTASAILGACLLASAWIQARATCELMAMEHQLQQAEYRMEQDRPSYQALVDNSVQAATEEAPAVTTTEPPSQEKDSQEDSQENQDNQVHRIKLPLQIDFDDLAGSLMERNQRAHMNCVVEKRRSEELVDHAARNVRLPFGVNLTTAPRLEHLTGERMTISCESGHDQQKHMPMPMPMHGAPIVIPLPGPLNLPLSFHGPNPHQMNNVEMHHQQQANQQMNHHNEMPQPEHVEMIIAHHHMPPPPPVPLSAMMPPPPQHHQQQERAEGRSFHGGLPMNMPMRNMPMPEQLPQQLRPHYVQPRSVPSLPDFLRREKRVKRCACDCAC